jgi:glycosyltransferase involved in cell wall biosynthesis
MGAMRIGIWCDYGFTLEPSEGIGVFVDNLARGLVRADTDCQVVLMAHNGQENLLRSSVAGGLGRIDVVSGPRVSKIRKQFNRTIKRFRGWLDEPTSIKRFWTELDSWTKWLEVLLSPRFSIATQSTIDSCDVWLLPYVGLEKEFSRPTVVAIHDLVCYHFPDVMSPPKLKTFKKLVNCVSRRATIAACMSEFIRDHDLFETLGLPPSRVRVIKAAVPDDLGLTQQVAKSDQAHKFPLPAGISGQYIFYPSAFRCYKNHRYLIEGLHLLKQNSASPLKLVFTGIHEMPTDLKALIRSLGLVSDVIVLKKVSRSVLGELYKNAFATIVPSLYEQGSFPVLEALQCRCPISVSDIPSLREQLEPMGEDIIFFDPHDPSTLQAIVEQISKNRDAVIESQHQGFQRLKKYTWTSAAQVWLEIFREAIAFGDSIESSDQERLAS